jgi:hypothetical protein
LGVVTVVECVLKPICVTFQLTHCKKVLLIMKTAQELRQGNVFMVDGVAKVVLKTE